MPPCGGAKSATAVRRNAFIPTGGGIFNGFFPAAQEFQNKNPVRRCRSFRIDPARVDASVGFLYKKMTLGNILTVEQIVPELRAADRWSAIVELTDLLVGQGKIKSTDRDAVLAALKAREETMSTGIGLGIAIPHASSDRVGEVVAAFGRSSKGIEFDSLDNMPVQFVVLFVSPKDQAQTHLRTLAAIAKFLNDRTVREKLAAAKSPGEILAIFGGEAQGK
jgi:nitrogen PTS system EIIA component